jgi:hypothetical protein
MNGTLIDGVLDWPRQKVDFEPDGSLRDIYVENATVEDWKLVVARILDGNYAARLRRGSAEAPLPADFESLFEGALEGNDRYFMSFTLGDIVLDCHFFTSSEIEFSFAPNDVTEASMHGLLAFLIEVGEAIRKPVIMTPENCPQAPIFSYDPDGHQLRWISPDGRH